MDAPLPPRTPRGGMGIGRSGGEASDPVAALQRQQQLQQHQVVTTIVIGAVLLLLFMLVTTFSHEQARRGPRLKSLMHTAAEWSAVAAQDESPVVRLLHVVYAVGALHAARAIASDADIEAAWGHSTETFSRSLSEQQAAAIRAISTQCPAMKLPTGLAPMLAGWTLSA